MPPPLAVSAATPEVPRKVVDVVPDLSGLDLADLHGFVIVEILIDERGDVKETCLLRGVREDVDLRVMAAIRQWRFEPVRLRHSTPQAYPFLSSRLSLCRSGGSLRFSRPL